MKKPRSDSSEQGWELSLIELRTDLRHGEREPAVTTPPATMPVAVRAEPATIVVKVHAQQERMAVGTVDRLVIKIKTPIHASVKGAGKFGC